MTAQRLIFDRPMLRLFTGADDPDHDITADDWTVQRAFDRFRWPELQHKRSAGDGQRWLRFWLQFETELAEAQRISNPLRLSAITTEHLRTYQQWLEQHFPLPKGASSIKKAVNEIELVLRLAAEKGCQVQSIRKPKPPRVRARPRYSIDDCEVAQLWEAMRQSLWPPATYAPKRGCEFLGTGVAPADFLRSILVLLRTYGMRVQDLVAYAHDKQPLRWGDISFDPRSPNPESNERWPLGWLYYKASKTAESSEREYYLPLMPAARAAIDRMRAGALRFHGGHLPPDAKVFLCPKSHGLTARFKRLQESIGLTTRLGDHYLWEDFRKTVASRSAVIHDGLPDALCGWQSAGGVRHRNYQLPEILLCRRLHAVDLPPCFDAWVDPLQSAEVRAWVRDNYTRHDD